MIGKEKTLTIALACMQRLEYSQKFGAVMQDIMDGLGDTPDAILDCLDLIDIDPQHAEFVEVARHLFDLADLGDNNTKVVTLTAVPKDRVIDFQWTDFPRERWCTIETSLPHDKIAGLLSGYGALRFNPTSDSYTLVVSRLYDLDLIKVFCSEVSQAFNGKADLTFAESLSIIENGLVKMGNEVLTAVQSWVDSVQADDPDPDLDPEVDPDLDPLDSPEDDDEWTQLTFDFDKPLKQPITLGEYNAKKSESDNDLDQPFVGSITVMGLGWGDNDLLVDFENFLKTGDPGNLDPEI